jgi:uncharacterized protein YbaR (Trm112 family)
MIADNDIAALLACPRCDSGLKQVDEHYQCPGCKLTFPRLDGIPVLVAEPTTTLGEWRERHHMLLEKLGREQRITESSLADPSLPPLTRQRLELLATAQTQHIAELKTLLAPLEMSGYTAQYETYLALRTRLPSDQGVNTYYPNIHRDWGWGDEENRLSTELVSDGLADSAPGPTLVAGAGAGRLAYDLARLDAKHPTVALDFNPLLLLVAAAMGRGDTITLTEFPIAPKRMRDIAVTRKLCAPRNAPNSFHLVMADALRPPFKAKAFTRLVTPWLIDVIPESLNQFAARVNQLLSAGGRWVSFGSLAFGHPDKRHCLSIEEVEAEIAAAGFDDISVTEAEIPYMCSPASRHGRREQVVVIKANKAKSTKRPPRSVTLPDWIVKGDSPVPLSESFQMQAASTRIYAFIMSLIDGKRSLQDMAQHMEQQKLMTAAEAESSIRSFLIRMHEDSQLEKTY